jgi:hypothetical protein
MFEFMDSFFFSIFTVGDQNFDGPILILSQKLLLSQFLEIAFLPLKK